MKMSGNTILITGGGSGIGRGLAEAFHALGNQVIIAGRRQESLDEVTTANPGMKSYQLDVTSPVGIAALAKKVTDEVAGLNVVIHNSGIMRPEDYTADRVDPQTAEATIATNLLGPIRLTAALLPHLKTQAASTIMTVSSGLAFTPLALTPSYCATKAAIHSWSISLRHQLRDTSVEVLELAPPYVQTELMGPHQANDPPRDAPGRLYFGSDATYRGGTYAWRDSRSTRHELTKLGSKRKLLGRVRATEYAKSLIQTESRFSSETLEWEVTF